MRKAHIVQLSLEERAQLLDLIAAGAALAGVQTHARVLLKADQGPAGAAWTDIRIAEALEISARTVARVRQRWTMEGLDAALRRRPPRRAYRRCLDGRAEAHLAMLACSTPPAGAARWTIRLLTKHLVAAELVSGVGRETVRLTLKKTNSSRG